MFLSIGYHSCEHFQKSISKIISVLLLFFSCYVQNSYSDCGFPTKTDESKDIFKRLHPLQGKILTVSGFEVGICTSPNSTEDAVIYNKAMSFGLLKQSFIATGTNYIQLSYESSPSSDCNNQTRWSNIMFVCDSHSDLDKLELLETPPKNKTYLRCSYTFVVGTRHACFVKEGLSSGSIFCILFFTAVGLYLLLGFLYQRLLVGAKGLEQIPNYGFWKDFGNLQADGCDFFCRCGPRQEAQSYRGIDDRLPRDDERDDQLLNM